VLLYGLEVCALNKNEIDFVTSCARGRHNMPPPRTWPWPLTFWP